MARDETTDGSVQRRVRLKAGVEENALAVFDAFESSDPRYSHDDRIAFLESVRVPRSLQKMELLRPSNLPICKMLETIFRILRTGELLQSIMASFQLLDELEKCYPRVFLSVGGTSESSSAAQPELEVLKEPWSPLSLAADSATSGRAAVNENPCGPLDPSGFDLLIQGLFTLVDGTNRQVVDMESLRNMLLLQYLSNFYKVKMSCLIVNPLICAFVPYNEGLRDYTLLQKPWIGLS
ncbi:negative regulator of systemic acquired resistance SNI1-like [Rhodamnia argentea]|uniref:Negative regulator of systemic acquired resistance SNI1-like n=1 Tax=Rhodamnia argentea TaxID=178133 RepID=A0ABM3HGE1_9MYRT|nr:negative regulator of systemic acquired resistance SNI1-like [Rhodamnia argentea]